MLFARKRPQVPRQDWRSPRTAERRSPGRSPAFSYYASRNSQPGVAPPSQIRRGSPPEASKKSSARTRLLKRWPQLLALAVGLVCVGKVLYVSGSPKIVVKQLPGVSETFLQPTSVYAVAASKEFNADLANHIKLTADVTAVGRDLASRFPELASVSVTLPLIGNRPIVYLTPAQPSLVLQASSGSYYVSTSGTVLAQAAQTSSEDLLVRDETGSQPQPGKQILPGGTVSFIKTVAYQLNAAKLQVSGFVLPATSAYELDARLAGKPYVVRFNLQADPLEQSGAVIATIDQMGSTVPSQYIDARVPERIYYK